MFVDTTPFTWTCLITMHLQRYVPVFECRAFEKHVLNEEAESGIN